MKKLLIVASGVSLSAIGASGDGGAIIGCFLAVVVLIIGSLLIMGSTMNRRR